MPISSFAEPPRERRTRPYKTLHGDVSRAPFHSFLQEEYRERVLLLSPLLQQGRGYASRSERNVMGKQLSTENYCATIWLNIVNYM